MGFDHIFKEKIGFGLSQHFVLFVIALFEIGDGANITTCTHIHYLSLPPKYRPPKLMETLLQQHSPPHLLLLHRVGNRFLCLRSDRRSSRQKAHHHLRICSPTHHLHSLPLHQLIRGAGLLQVFLRFRLWVNLRHWNHLLRRIFPSGVSGQGSLDRQLLQFDWQDLWRLFGVSFPQRLRLWQLEDDDVLFVHPWNRGAVFVLLHHRNPSLSAFPETIRRSLRSDEPDGGSQRTLRVLEFRGEGRVGSVGGNDLRQRGDQLLFSLQLHLPQDYSLAARHLVLPVFQLLRTTDTTALHLRRTEEENFLVLLRHCLS